MPKPPTILQPIAATTSLAGMFNQWLEALAPVERLTSPRYSTSYTRKTLLALTIQLHGMHHAAVRAIDLLEQGAPLEKLVPYFVGDSIKKAGIGGRIANKSLLFAYAAQDGRLASAAELSRFNNLSTKSHTEIYRQPTAFTLIRLGIEAALVLSNEADWCFYALKRDTQPARTQLLQLLRALLNG